MDLQIDSLTLLKQIYDSAIDFAILTLNNDGKVTSWNAGAQKMFGYAAQEIIGSSSAILFTPEDREIHIPAIEMRIARASGRATDYRWHVRKDKTRFWADSVLTPIRSGEDAQIGYLKILRDITHRKLAQDEITRLANFDVLTGLANRRSFECKLSEMINIAGKSGDVINLYMLNLDRFKQINDSLGHHAADLLLQQVAHRIRSVLTESDFVARLSGDEFAILQRNLALPHAGSDLANRMIAGLSDPIKIGEREVLMSCSIGIAVFPNDAADADHLLKKADLALERSKREGGGCFHYFTPELDAMAHRRSTDIAEVRLAVGAKDFWLEYQPIVDCDSGRTIALEALLRFSSPLLASYPVEYVIGLAAETGLMPNIGLWVLEEACAQLGKIKRSGLTGLKICVNLCSEELMDPATVWKIRDILQATGLDPSELEIEITERQAVEIGKHSINMLNTLRSQGILISLDDFGTGFSALSYLQSLPVTTLKLDKSFLQGIPHEPQSCAIAKAVINLARTLNLQVIAEGVEQNEQADFLRGESCSALQGFLFSKPISGAHLDRWLSANSVRRGDSMRLH